MFLSNAPRFPIEALGMTLIAIVAFFMAKGSSGLESIIPTLGAFALGAQRSLPVLQNAYRSWASIKGGQAALEDIVELLEQELPASTEQENVSPVSFENSLVLKNVSYRYTFQMLIR